MTQQLSAKVYISNELAETVQIAQQTPVIRIINNSPVVSVSDQKSGQVQIGNGPSS